MINPKYVLVNMIEERLNITFTNEQLAYIFNEDANLLMTAPRKYGKDLITAVKIALQLLLNDDYRIGVLCTSKETARMLYEQIKDLFTRINMDNQISSCNKSILTIRMHNNSQVSLFSSESDMRGHRLNEAYIVEFCHQSGIDTAINRARMLTAHSSDYKINVIGTPTSNMSMETILNSLNPRRHIMGTGLDIYSLNSDTVITTNIMPEYAATGQLIFNTSTNDYYIGNEYGELVPIDLR